MHKLFALFGFIVFGLTIITFGNVRAISNNVVISVVQIGDIYSANNELVEIYNNSAETVEVTNWCLYYASEQNTTIGNKMSCLVPETINSHIYLPARASVLFVSNYLKSQMSATNYDELFSETLSGKSGHVRLIDSNKIEIDKVAWGMAVSPELKPTDTPMAGYILKRKMSIENTYIDSDDNYNDFEIVSSEVPYESGNIFEVDDVCTNIDGVQAKIPDDMIVNGSNECTALPIDICLNIEGMQTAVAAGFAVNEYNECVPDLCSNIDGIQSSIPEGYIQDDFACSLPDLCLNLENIQSTVPPGYYQTDSSECLLRLDRILINELLPNADGIDAGNEFIELFNPNDSEINLEDYRLQIMPSGDIYEFPKSSIIKPNEYLTFFNHEIKFTLSNSEGSVNIISSDDQEIDSSALFDNPNEGLSWSLIEGVWQYTNQLTPNLENRASIISENTNLIPCGPNQYRNEVTGRCRNITTNSSLAPCRDGQYRSETTGRCRNLASDVSILIPCSEGEERNPATNRCRKITGTVLGSSELKPCSTNQYRNPETNRCKNIVALASADYAPENIVTSSDNSLISFSYLAVFVLAAGYGIWEWRAEVFKTIKKFRKFIHLR